MNANKVSAPTMGLWAILALFLDAGVLLVGGGAVFGVVFLGETSLRGATRGRSLVPFGVAAGVVAAVNLGPFLVALAVALLTVGPPERAVRFFTRLGAGLAATIELVLLFTFGAWTNEHRYGGGRNQGAPDSPILNSLGALVVCTLIGAWCGRALIVGHLRRTGQAPPGVLRALLPARWHRTAP